MCCERSGYDLTMLAMPGGQRRLANVRKLMRLAREHEARLGPRPAWLPRAGRAAAGRAGRLRPDSRESEAPVEGEALDAVRLMTIHRAKGLEFEIVCVADLGRMPRRRAELLRVGRDGRLGLRLPGPGPARRSPRSTTRPSARSSRRPRGGRSGGCSTSRMTRARERLILSGAARARAWRERRDTPIALARAGVRARHRRRVEAEGSGTSRPTAQDRVHGRPPRGRRSRAPAASPAPEPDRAAV